MKVYKEKTATVVQAKTEVAYRLVEDDNSIERVDLEMVQAETGKHITWLATLTTNGIHIHEFSKPCTDTYNFSEDMFQNNQLNVEYGRGRNQ
jgi:hypothetical protein